MTRALVAALPLLGTAQYTFVDRSAPRARTVYWIEAVRLDGRRAWVAHMTA